MYAYFVKLLDNILYFYKFDSHKDLDLLRGLDYFISNGIDHFIIKTEYFYGGRYEDYFYIFNGWDYFLLTVGGIATYELSLYFLGQKYKNKIDTSFLSKKTLFLMRFVPIICFLTPFFSGAKGVSKKHLLWVNILSYFIVLILTGFVLPYGTQGVSSSILDIILAGNTVLFLAVINRDKLKLKWTK